jgi:hypothetical protein
MYLAKAEGVGTAVYTPKRERPVRQRRNLTLP